MAIGIVDTGQAILNAAPSELNHAVPLWYLRKAFAGGIEGIDIGPGTLFPFVRADIEGRAAYVDEQGYLSPARNSETGGGERTIGFVRGGRLYLDNMFVQGMSGLQVGYNYFLQGDGTLSVTPPTGENLWSVRVGLAISATTLYMSIAVQGGV